MGEGRWEKGAIGVCESGILLFVAEPVEKKRK